MVCSIYYSFTFDNFKTIEWIENFEIDKDIKNISYKLNKRYKDDKKYKISIKNIMFDNSHHFHLLTLIQSLIVLVNICIQCLSLENYLIIL